LEFPHFLPLTLPLDSASITVRIESE